MSRTSMKIKQMWYYLTKWRNWKEPISSWLQRSDCIRNWKRKMTSIWAWSNFLTSNSVLLSRRENRENSKSNWISWVVWMTGQEIVRTKRWTTWSKNTSRWRESMMHSRKRSRGWREAISQSIEWNERSISRWRKWATRVINCAKRVEALSTEIEFRIISTEASQLQAQLIKILRLKTIHCFSTRSRMKPWIRKLSKIDSWKILASNWINSSISEPSRTKRSEATINKSTFSKTRRDLIPWATPWAKRCQRKSGCISVTMTTQWDAILAIL